MGKNLRRETLSELIRSRRTRKPALFKPEAPAPDLIKELIDVARHAPNHYRTEPARFYLMTPLQIKKLGLLFGEIVAGTGNLQELVEKGKRKEKEWGNAPGLLVVTSYTDRHGLLASKSPELIFEDYASCCCIVQNLLLLFEAEGIASKWSTGPVWEHADFNNTVGIQSPDSEKVVALLFYGISDQELPPRKYSDLNLHLKHQDC